jgi:hypothetical protein
LVKRQCRAARSKCEEQRLDADDRISRIEDKWIAPLERENQNKYQDRGQPAVPTNHKSDGGREQDKPSDLKRAVARVRIEDAPSECAIRGLRHYTLGPEGGSKVGGQQKCPPDH